MTKTETSRTETSDRTAVLVLTVGTGDMSDMNRLEESLFRPLEKSLRDGRFRLAVLLPSQSTMGNAQQFKDRIEQRMHGFDIRIEPLPAAGWENDADACFGHFDHVLNQLKRCHGPEAIVPDFTRGTKAMSAALVLAAIRHDLPKLRYIHGERDSRHGMVVAGTETIREVSPRRATMRRRLDEARQLMGKGAFAAVSELLRNIDGSDSPPPANPAPNEFRDQGDEEFGDEIGRLRWLARFWSAWDRLDYGKAAKIAGELRPGHRYLNDLRSELERVRRLAEKPPEKPANREHPEKTHPAAMAEWLRLVARDLLANGRRRIAQDQFEDAILRAYRVREMIGQFLLFENGYDSGKLDPEDPKVSEFNEELIKKGSNGLGARKKDGKKFLTAGLEQTTRFLLRLDNQRGKKLKEFDDTKDSSVKADKRNHSILIHGFEAVGPDADSLNALYRRIAALLNRVAPDDASRTGGDRFGCIP